MRNGAAILLALLLVSLGNSIFLVGQGPVGEKIPILCEQQERVFLSSPDGQVQQLSLDSSFEADFTPTDAGPYTVQCGRETKTISVAAAQPNEPEMAQAVGDENLAILAVLCFSAFALLAAAAVGRQFFTQAVFSKAVQGSRVRLYLKAGKKMEKILIEDPVSFGCKKPAMKFSIPALEAGRDWSWEYDIDEPERALPASLAALEGGKKIPMLSRLLIEGRGDAGAGKKAGSGSAAQIPKIKRKLARAT